MAGWRVPLDELSVAWTHGEAVDVRKGRGASISGELHDRLVLPVDLVLPASANDECLEPVISERVLVETCGAQRAQVLDHGDDLLGGEDALVYLLGPRAFRKLGALVLLRVYLHAELEPR